MTETLPEPMKYLGVDDEPDFYYYTAEQMHAHAAKLCAARDAEIERVKLEYISACGLVAEMHAAAMGALVGPREGIVKDVANVRAAATQADMVWNREDAEKPHDNVSCFLNDEICNGYLQVGATFEIMQAKRLPNIVIRVTSIDEENCEAEYEVVDAALQSALGGPTT